jgi:hypothetical protein
MKLKVSKYVLLFLVCFELNGYGQPNPRTREYNTIAIPNDSLFTCYKEGVLVAPDARIKYLMWMNPMDQPNIIFDFIAKNDSLLDASVLISIAYYCKGIYFRAEKLPADGGCYFAHSSAYCLENNINVAEGDTLEIIINNWEPYKVTELAYKTIIIKTMLKDRQMRFQFFNSDKKCLRKKRFGRN